MALAVSPAAWSQGGRRGAAAAQQTQQAPAPQPAPAAQPAAQPPGGFGGRGGVIPVPTSNEFYDFSTSAPSVAPIPDAPPAETHNKITINGTAIPYTTRAGFLPVRNATTGQSEAHLFYTCYLQEGLTDSWAHPVIFFLGGGQGVSAAWQEFGGLGPNRMKWAADGTPGPQPYSWRDNPYTLLGQADLVFVNPVGTSYSRPDSASRASNFWNAANDVASLAEFVRTFLNSNGRRNSPVFLAGEDFGTGRTAGLAAYLNDHQIPVQGIVLLSTTIHPDAVAGDAEYITLLPSMVMAAWQHKKLAPDLNAMSAEQISGQARQFASREYLHALYKGDRMTADERAKVIADMARLTGLSKAFIVNNDLRITRDRFATELLRDQHRALSNSDSRVSGFVPLPAGGGRGGFGGAVQPAIDYNLSALSAAFDTMYEAYVRGELKFGGAANGIPYLSSGGVGTFTSTGNDDSSLAGAFARNPHLRLFVAVNYFDLTAPFFATEFTLAHLSVSPEVRAHNITVSHYESGQMAFVDNKALEKLHADLARFIGETASHK